MVLAVSDHFGITHDSAENRIKRAREEDFLEPVKKVSAKSAGSKKERKGNAKRKRNNLAIYTLAGSILLSSVIVSMNQSNAHTTDSKK